jgi:hypothetical protein
MAAVAVVLPPGKAAEPETMDLDASTSGGAAGHAAAGGEEDLYTRLKTLQRQLEFLEIQVGLLGWFVVCVGQQQQHLLCAQHMQRANRPVRVCCGWCRRRTLCGVVLLGGLRAHAACPDAAAASPAA